MIGKKNHFIKVVLQGMIKLYQYFLSPLLPSSCRFYPSCSEYMLLSIEKNGSLKGVWQGLLRLLRCHPFYKKNGIDFPI